MAGHGCTGERPRFVVTSLKAGEAKARHLYEKIYCARGEMENRIKEYQADLFADRTSSATMRAKPKASARRCKLPITRLR